MDQYDEKLAYSTDNLPAIGEFATYKKKVTTKAVKVDGPFAVHTREGTLTCQDGYLAIDSAGYPYPIAKEEFEAIYEPVE